MDQKALCAGCTACESLLLRLGFGQGVKSNVRNDFQQRKVYTCLVESSK